MSLCDAEARSLVVNTVLSMLLFPIADGELYAGTVSNFQGNEPIIYKSLSQGTSLKTENSLNWLQGMVPQPEHNHIKILFHIQHIDTILKRFVSNMMF